MTDAYEYRDERPRPYQDLVEIQKAQAVLQDILAMAMGQRPSTLEKQLCYEMRDRGVDRAVYLISFIAEEWKHPDRAESDTFCIKTRRKDTDADRWRGFQLNQRIALIRYSLKRLRDWERRAKRCASPK